MASTVPDKAPLTTGVPSVTAWEPPSAADRALVHDGLTRNGAHDLADALGLLPQDPPPDNPGWPACPTCGAVAGAVCKRVASGKDMLTVHNDRRRA